MKKYDKLFILFWIGIFVIMGLSFIFIDNTFGVEKTTADTTFQEYFILGEKIDWTEYELRKLIRDEIREVFGFDNPVEQIHPSLNEPETVPMSRKEWFKMKSEEAARQTDEELKDEMEELFNFENELRDILRKNRIDFEEFMSLHKGEHDLEKMKELGRQK